MEALTCVRCGGSLDEGFLLDHTSGGYWTAHWVGGTPERSLWTGLNVKDRPKHPVTAYRCADCGRLELYTPCEGQHLLRPAESPGEEDARLLLRPSDPGGE
jgi:hypothetical protein